MAAPKFLGLLTQLLLLAALAQAQTVTLSTSQNPSTFGAPVTLTATVAPSNATGRVTFYDGVTVLGTKPLSAGTASLLTGLLPAGSRKLKAYYAGDSSNAAATSNVVTQTVNAQPSSGTFAQGRTLHALGLVVADFDGDGKADIASGFIDIGGFVILLGNGDGTFKSGFSSSILDVAPVSAGDFNGDGKADLITQNLRSGEVSIWLSNGDGTLQSPLAIITVSSFSVVVVEGDFNGDGKSDLIIADSNGLKILLGRGDGTFQPPVAYTSFQPGLGDNTVVVGDFNGDGKADLAAINSSSAVSILLGNGDGTFRPPVSVTVLGPPASLAVGDFNKDGLADLAIAHLNSPQISILLGKGDGTFQTPVINPGGTPLSYLVVGDFNGDGNPDLAGGSPVSVLLGNGDGTFQLAINSRFSGFSLIAAEFNGDGKTDLANSDFVLLGTTLSVTATGGTPQSTPIGTAFPTQLQVTVRDGANPVSGATVTFVAPQFGPSLTFSSTTAITDISGVARVNATANLQPGSYLVTGFSQGLSAVFALTNTSGPPANLTISGGTPQSATVGTAFSTALKVKLTDLTGNPASGVTVTFTVPSSGSTAVLSSATAVTDASGVASVTATANSIAGTYTVTASFGSLSARFSLANVLASTVTLAASLNPSVFGAPVVLTATVAPSTATGRVTFYDGVTVLGSKPLSAGTASLSTILLQAGNRKLTAYYSGDATYLAATASISQTVRTVAAVGFRATGLLSVAPAAPAGVSVGDFNGDGKADLAIAGTSSNQAGSVTVLLGNGDGTFQAPASYAVGASLVSVAIADFNGDGNPDIAVSSLDTQHNGIVSMLLGNGDGTFRSPVNFPAAYGALLVADFNGDGKADLVGLGGPVLNVYLGNGDGTFKAPIAFSFGSFVSSAGAVGDFNGDGKPDIATVTTPGDLVILFGNGDGTFQSPVSLNAGSFASSIPSLTAADFNGDGKTDLAVGGAADVPIQKVLLSNGDGTFHAPVSYPVGGAVTVGDFNGDGMIDLAIVGLNGDTTVSILQGNGDGTFHLVLSYATAAGAMVVADFNGDGRADIAAAAFSTGFPPGGTVNILLGVTSGVSLNVTGGSPQSTLAGTPFSVPLQVTAVRDGSPVNGAIVTFTAPSSGPSAVLFPPAAAVTNIAGVASVIATANGVAGSYVVSATYQGLTASFSLTNTTVASIVASGGTPQFTLVNTRFPKPLEVTVRDSAGNLASGATVTFSAPTNGASASLPGTTAVTNAVGQAFGPTPFANNIAGSYTVTARLGTLSAAFSLTNTQIASVTTTGGTPQSTSVGTAFPNALQVTIKDSTGRPASNVFVSFAAPSSGASAVLASTVAFTNASGIASVIATANNIVGSYTIIANTAGLSASFSLTNLPAGTVSSVNLALGGTATQSSTLSGYATTGPAGAIDGSTDGNFFHGSVTHTNQETNPWWQVDLGASAPISSIVIWNRTDCCSNRLTDYWVFASDTPFSPTDTPATLQNRIGIFSNHQLGTPNPSTTIPVGGVLGRYVRVQLTGTDALSLAEVQVLGAPGSSSSVNLALGKPATQSSNLNSTSGASRAVDGNTDGNYFHGSVTHTNQEAYPWWQVDLGSTATVNSIVISNRTDCCGNRLSNYWVFVSNIPFGGDNPYSLANRPGTFSMFLPGDPNSPTTTITVGGFQGQFVRVQLQDSNPLSLAEVQVFGTPGTSSLLNLALGKPAAQSSTISGYVTAAAGSAVDGNTDGNFFNGSVTHTNLDINPWWQVDLGASAAISAIVVWNRTDPCCTGRLTNFWVFVSDTPFSPTDTSATLSTRAGTFSSQQFSPPNPSTAFVITGAQGRYVRVQIAGANNLSLAEVQVYGTPVNLSGSNLALGKAAAQSSTLSGYASTGAGSAVDGITDGNFFNSSVTHTNLEANAWWQVDLGASSAISSIAIWNRTDCCSTRLNDYWVFVSDTPFSPTDTPATLQGRAGTFGSHQTATPGPSATIPAITQGRYVRVQLTGTNNLSLAEVQVIGQ